jgi:hypothetical protein
MQLFPTDPKSAKNLKKHVVPFHRFFSILAQCVQIGLKRKKLPFTTVRLCNHPTIGTIKLLKQRP